MYLAALSNNVASHLISCPGFPQSSSLDSRGLSIVGMRATTANVKPVWPVGALEMSALASSESPEPYNIWFSGFGPDCTYAGYAESTPHSFITGTGESRSKSKLYDKL